MDPVFNAGVCGHSVRDLPANAMCSLINSSDINGTYPVGAKLQLDCETGYTPLGIPSYCQPDGSWSPDYRCLSNNITSFNTLKIGFVPF